MPVPRPRASLATHRRRASTTVSTSPGTRPDQTRLESLTAARDEAEIVRGTLEKAGYRVKFIPPDSKAVAVLNELFDGPYRVLAIAAHGLVNAPARDGIARTGVVLSDGILLTAAEVGLMEVVPDLVFLNCCHLGKLEARRWPATSSPTASLAN